MGTVRVASVVKWAAIAALLAQGVIHLYEAPEMYSEVPYLGILFVLTLAGALVATVGMWPTIVMYVYYGKVVGDVAALAAGVAPQRGRGYYVLLAVGLVATIVATTMVTRAAKKAMTV